MRATRRMLAVVAGVLCTCALVATPAKAEPYAYTVRLFAGNQGTVDGGTVSTLGTDFVSGQELVLSRDLVQLRDDSKYYVRGFRISGQDQLVSSLVIAGDTDLVVAYGVRGNMVSYTVHYVVEATGEELGHATFMGKVGDKPVEGYACFEGYHPLYRNITGTLVDGSNEWTLPYAVGNAVSPALAEEQGSAAGEVASAATVMSATAVANGQDTGAAEDEAAGQDPYATVASPIQGESLDEADGAIDQGIDSAGDATTPDASEGATQQILDVDNPLASPDEAEARASVVHDWEVVLVIAVVVIAAFLFLYQQTHDEEKD